jgi:uncharacterized protein (DUF885 family)
VTAEDAGQEVVVRFFDRLMELRPVDATYHGLHRHDHRLPDGGLAGVRELRDLVGRFESDLAGLGDGLELDLSRYCAGLMRFDLEERRLWARMPEAPGQVGTGVFLLFARDTEPLEDRLEAIAARLEAVPAYLAASREQLQEPVRLWCEIAAMSARQLPTLFSLVVSAALRDPLRGRLEAAAGPASEAAEDFAAWLERDVAPGGATGWALGEEGFAALLERRELPDGPDAVLALGRSYLQAMEEARRELLAAHWPGRSLQEVDQLVRSDRPDSFEAALASYRRAIADSREFVSSRGLATLPPGEELRVEATPAFMRPVLPFAAYEPPAHFDRRQLGIYMVTPREGDLGDYNRAQVLNTSLHEGYPGHHLQFACASRNPSLARLLGAEFAVEFVEGWAHYCEQLMAEQGFDSTPEVRLVQLNDLVWRACRVIIDVELSSGRMGFAEAVDMLATRAAMPRRAAEAEVRRYTYTPGYQLSYLYGKHLLLDLRERRRQDEGAAFDLRRFHDRLLYAGALPAATWDALF